MTPTASQIGQKLREWREAAGIAREKAAPMADSTTRTLARWEDGEGDVAPPTDQFFKLVVLYGATAKLAQWLGIIPVTTPKPGAVRSALPADPTPGVRSNAKADSGSGKGKPKAARG